MRPSPTRFSILHSFYAFCINCTRRSECRTAPLAWRNPAVPDVASRSAGHWTTSPELQIVAKPPCRPQGSGTKTINMAPYQDGVCTAPYIETSELVPAEIARMEPDRIHVGQGLSVRNWWQYSVVRSECPCHTPRYDFAGCVRLQLLQSWQPRRGDDGWPAERRAWSRFSAPTRA